MKITLADREDFKSRSSNGIPWQLLPYVNAFSTPSLLASPVLDLIYQDYTINGCTIRHIVYHTKNPVVVAMSLGRPKSVIQFILNGNMEIQLQGIPTVTLEKGHFYVFRIDSEEHRMVLQPGISEELRLEYRGDVLKEYLDYARVQSWLKRMTPQQSAYLDSGEIDAHLYKIYDKLKRSSPKDSSREAWFTTKLREMLEIVVQQESVNS